MTAFGTRAAAPPGAAGAGCTALFRDAAGRATLAVVEEVPIAPPAHSLPATPDALDEADVPDAVDMIEAADLDAVRRTLSGETEAFTGIVRRHAHALVALCARMVNDARLGEELAQEAFARAYSSLGSFRGDCRLRHWLFRIGVNGCRDHLKAGARAERPTALSGDELVHALDPERDAAARQAVSALASAVAELPPMYREAFVLFHVENLSYEEIRAITGARTNALKVRVHRARHMLRERLGDFLGEVTP